MADGPGSGADPRELGVGPDIFGAFSGSLGLSKSIPGRGNNSKCLWVGAFLTYLRNSEEATVAKAM